MATPVCRVAAFAEMVAELLASVRIVPSTKAAADSICTLPAAPSASITNLPPEPTETSTLPAPPPSSDTIDLPLSVKLPETVDNIEFASFTIIAASPILLLLV